MIDRPEYMSAIRRGLETNPVVALLGPRQCGKTTLAQLFTTEGATYFDLESPRDLSRLSAPMTALEGLSGLIVIDEVQRKPGLFESLRVLVDRPTRGTRFLLLGSASPRIVRGVSESLAGRIGFVDLSGFDLREIGASNFRRLWYRGGLPRSYLARDEATSDRWRNDFVRTFLERDIPQLGITIPAETLRRFWTMIAHYHGQTWNAAEFARSLGRAEGTARHYLDILSGAYMVRQLQPWYENLKKRQVKSPKVYIRDTGLLHTLLAPDLGERILEHPKLGASWEGFVIEQIIRCAGSRDVYFWSAHSGAEIDLMIPRSGKRVGFEVKYADAPKTTKSMRSAMSDLQLAHVYIVYPGAQSYPLDRKITVQSIRDVPALFGHDAPEPGQTGST